MTSVKGDLFSGGMSRAGRPGRRPWRKTKESLYLEENLGAFTQRYAHTLKMLMEQDNEKICLFWWKRMKSVRSFFHSVWGSLSFLKKAHSSNPPFVTDRLKNRFMTQSGFPRTVHVLPCLALL